MAYRRKRAMVAGRGRRRVYRVRGRGPKNPSRFSTVFLGRAFNLQWLFGRNRHYRRNVR